MGAPSGKILGGARFFTEKVDCWARLPNGQSHSEAERRVEQATTKVQQYGLIRPDLPVSSLPAKLVKEGVIFAAWKKPMPVLWGPGRAE